jgi:hypothetical protein
MTKETQLATSIRDTLRSNTEKVNIPPLSLNETANNADIFNVTRYSIFRHPHINSNTILKFMTEKNNLLNYK